MLRNIQFDIAFSDNTSVIFVAFRIRGRATAYQRKQHVQQSIWCFLLHSSYRARQKECKYKPGTKILNPGPIWLILDSYDRQPPEI
jgi:hypothetical protein